MGKKLEVNRQFTKTNEKGCVRELYRAAHNIIISKACGTNGSIETPVKAQLKHALLFVPFQLATEGVDLPQFFSNDSKTKW